MMCYDESNTTGMWPSALSEIEGKCNSQEGPSPSFSSYSTSLPPPKNSPDIYPWRNWGQEDKSLPKIPQLHVIQGKPESR